MKSLDILRRAGQNVKGAKIRTFLTSTSIAVGAFTITLAFAAGAGGQKYANSFIENSGDTQNLSVSAPYETEEKQDGPAEYGVTTEKTASEKGFLTDKDIETLKKVKGVVEVKPSYSIEALYMTRPGEKKYETYATIKNDKTKLELIAGELPNNSVAPGKIVIAQEYLKPLGFSSATDAIGKQVDVNFAQPQSSDAQSGMSKNDAVKNFSFDVVAVSKKTDTVLFYQEQLQISPEDGKEIYHYQNANQPDANNYVSADVEVAANADVTQVQKAIENENYSVFSLEDVRGALFGAVKVVQYGIASFGAIALLAAIFGIINTQYISVYERTQQIGLMKALGARGKDIGRLFRYEAAWVGFLGGIFGTVLALLVGLFNPLITKNLDLEEGTQLLVFNPLTSIIIIAGLMLIAVLAGWLPSRKAAKLEPIEALRTE